MDCTRRDFVSGLTLAGTAGLLGVRPEIADAEPPPETTTIKIGLSPSLCAAPQFVAEELLRSEGFPDVQNVRPATPAMMWPELASWAVHLSAAFSGPFIIRVDARDPIVLLGGIHTGCFELFGGERVRADPRFETELAKKTRNPIENRSISQVPVCLGRKPKIWRTKLVRNSRGQ